jgi:hypothetical protein
MGLHEFVHILKRHIVDVFIRILGFDEIIGSLAALASLAIHHRIVEGRDVASGFPNLRIHENARIESDVGRRFLDETFPPGGTDVFLEFGAQRTIVPAIREAPVDLGTRIDVSGQLQMRRDLLKIKFTSHCQAPLSIKTLSL